MNKHREEGNVMRGIVYGILFSIPIWVIIGLIIWWVATR